MQHHNRQKSSTFPRDREVRKIYTFTIPREGFDELNPDKQILRQLISKHISMVDRLKKNMSYYEGKHKILDETKRENRLVCNHAKDIEQDIHKFSHIPCMSDESFGGNVSGVAMEFKLLGMENITKIKTRYYKKGLRKRVRIFCNYLALHGISIDPSGITMTFTRA